MTRCCARSGATPGEVLVVLAIVVVVVLMAITLLPRQREVARSMACRQNLGQIGIALALYDQTHRHLPVVDQAGPLEALRAGLGLDDFRGLADPKVKTARLPGPPPSPRKMQGFLCPSDRVAVESAFPAPTSYRANAGGDAAGRSGPFAFGVATSLKQLESANGRAYTAAFTERLVGDGRDGVESLAAYVLVDGPVGDAACPPARAAAWRGDAGADWGRAGWKDSLYTHALPPFGRPSCVAADGRTARMGASSGHVEGVHLLKLDLSVGVVSPRVDPEIWRRYGTVSDPAPPAPPAASPGPAD